MPADMLTDPRADPRADRYADLTDPGLRGTVRVLGGPGTGKSTALIDIAVARIAAGAAPESVLLLTDSARVGLPARGALTSALLRARSPQSCGAAVREPVVRTVHSYAFTVLRRAAQRNGDAPPRLITGAEQDSVTRELLAGDFADGAHSAVQWPPELRPALLTGAFATQLRDLLARCAERDVDPVALQRIGRRLRRPEWIAAGQFAQRYEQVMLLRAAVGMAAPQATVPALGAAELVGAALDAFAVDASLLAAERARLKIVLVDDAQHFDPQAARLVRVLVAGAELAVVAGDPNQAAFGFRGADSGLLVADESPALVLTRSHRCSAGVARVVSGIASRLPGVAPGRLIEGRQAQPDGRPGSVAVRLAASPHAEFALVADALRRAHLVDGVCWSQMAVILRSGARTAASFSRALASAGVPVVAPSPTGPLCEQPAVQALLTVLGSVATGLTGDAARCIVTGPIGRVDPVSLRQLRRGLRRADGARPARDFGELLVEELSGTARRSDALAPPLAAALRRSREVLSAARRSHRDSADPRHTLWQAWHRSGLARHWVGTAERGGSAGAQADRDLEAVTALFDLADQYVTRTAGASLTGLLDHLAALHLPAVQREPLVTADAVAVLSAHAALGREWDFVVIAGLQDGLWPNTVARGGVLATQRLVDHLDGVTAPDGPGIPAVSTRAPLLAEERRLLVAALGRARDRVLVTAVDGDGKDGATSPSPFFAELAELCPEPHTPVAAPARALREPGVLSAGSLVGRLRAVVCAPDGAVDEAKRHRAATQLARLAHSAVPGADPAQWYEMTPVSTAEPLWSGEDHVVALSPSTLQILDDCPLRWLVERHGGTDRRDRASMLGSVVHALLAGNDTSEDRLLADLATIWEQIPFDSQWYSRNELERHGAMVSAFLGWRAQTRGELTEVGTEVDVDGSLEADDASPAVRVRGRVDRVERDGAGRLVVVDIKTGRTPVTKDDAQCHAQLAMYQLAVAEGLLEPGGEPGGARLVYVGKPGAGGPPERDQSPLTPEGHDEWRAVVQRAAAATQGPQFLARVNDGCAHCPVRPSCPAHVTGGGSL